MGRVNEPANPIKPRGLIARAFPRWGSSIAPQLCHGRWRLLLLLNIAQAGNCDEVFIRANQLGYRPQDVKVAIAFSRSGLPASFTVIAADSDLVAFRGKTTFLSNQRWGQFTNHVQLDFSTFHQSGRFAIQVGQARSMPFSIEEPVCRQLPDQLLEFMRQQRCGYNPWLGTNCHQLDGRTAYGPLANGTTLDARGGWHDAADLLKYLITSGNATAQMLLAYQLASDRQATSAGVFGDAVDALGRPGANGLPDILDEARWGLEWMLKLHPSPDALYHQVADDRDHIGRRLPQNEIADYGWGKGGARVVYFADGRPQGLQQYKSDSTGIANLAGRYAAAMALAYQTWNSSPNHRAFAERCLRAGKEVYELGYTNEGVQQGNSYRAPYRYEETTWADDMEWGAAELFRVTRDRRYLADARRYAQRAAAESWAGKEQTAHYAYYPFMNIGHYRLYDIVDRRLKKTLAGYYRTGIDRCIRAAKGNPYGIGVPFIWCSDNLTVALATQCLLYERMTGDTHYRRLASGHRDWLLGRNPWGVTLFTGIGSVFPRAPHLMTMQLTGRPVRGGLVDGPVYERIFKSLRGVTITEPDPLADFQGPAVYHDDSQDYASNEPTMDGTASAILLWTLCDSQK
jgi:endoglucanase